VLLQSEIPFLFRPPEAEEDIVETHAGQAKAGEEGAGQGGAGRTFGVQGEGAETEDVIDRDVFFNKFIEKLGNCQFNEGKLLSRFAAQEAYCTALQENGETEKAAEILDPLRLDIELLQQLDLEMKFSRQYLQWALHQNNLVREYNGLCVAPRLDEILPIAEKISDYPMQEDILHRLCGENRTQINLYWRYMRLREIISKRMQDTVLQVWQVCEETILVDEDGARRLEERRKSTLEDLLKSHEEFDVPLLRRGIKRILEEFPENPDVQPQEVKQPPAQGPLFSAT
jgi:hypothetical protein